MFTRRTQDSVRSDSLSVAGPAPTTSSPFVRIRASIQAHPLAWRRATLVVVLALYAALTLGVLLRSPVIRVDRDFLHLDLRYQYPEWKPWVDHYVIFGQRGPATLVFLPFFVWVAWRTRSTRPLVMLATSFVLLNLSVGIVKLATGRLGPRQTTHAHEILVGGDIYPSGHVSNAVVLYGLVAMIALRYRVFSACAAVFLSITVGLGTVYLDTHWFSDVVGGWFAGALVLLVLPTAMPYAQRWTDAVTDFAASRWRRRHPVATPQATNVDAVEPQSANVEAAGPQSAKMVTPVSSAARSQSLAATTSSRDPLEDRTRCG